MSVLDVSTVERDIRDGQVAVFGRFGVPYLDGTDAQRFTGAAEKARADTASAKKRGCLSWRHILHQATKGAYAETDPARLRAALVEIASVAVAWIEAIDRRPALSSLPDTKREGDRV